MNHLTAGILAHVDAGKTTLSEALLYRAGVLRKLGRVDHRDAFLDTDIQERERGITIFSKQALLTVGDLSITLLDTPGHVDFTAETERTLGVLDVAIVVVSGPDGPQGHTLTLWKWLENAHVPVFLFLNKMDQPGVDRADVWKKAQSLVGDFGIDFQDVGTPMFWEHAALADEAALNEYLETDALSDHTLRRLIAERKLFPAFFGSALKLEGVDALLDGLRRFAPRPRWGDVFGARVYKISRDAQGVRLTHLKLTGGSLHVKDLIHDEKIDQLRLYSGRKFTALDTADAGTVCAAVGLTKTFPGQALGQDTVSWSKTASEPVLSYQLILPDGCDPYFAFPKLSELSEEDPQLHLEWNERLHEIRVRLMGHVQAEVLQRLIRDRFGWDVTFGPGRILYRETIAAPVEGVGHFEPLRHYAEVHLLLEPLALGSGLSFASRCSENELDRNWQRLILTHLMEKTHIGTLTGSPVTDMRFTLLCGKAHEKHTEGGDFRQATYRAVRQGLMTAVPVLLEPWYRFRLSLPSSLTALTGRALGDVQRMGGETETPETIGDETIVCGAAPVAGLRDYAQEVAVYTKGRGRLVCESGGWRPCSHQDAVAEAIGYDPERDTENPSGSIFCSHGAGHEVPWNEVPHYAHLPMMVQEKPQTQARSQEPPRRSAPSVGGLEQDKELMSIFERTYGTVKPRAFQPTPKDLPRHTGTVFSGSLSAEPEYLLVDGYNIIFAWEDLHALARQNLDAARKILMDLLSNYQGFRKIRVILVFDAYKVPQGTGAILKYHNIHVVYTKEAETADSYIERASYELAKGKSRVRVATSDAAEQFIILGHGALRMSAQELRDELDRTDGEIGEILRKNNLSLPSGNVRGAFEKAKQKNKSP